MLKLSLMLNNVNVKGYGKKFCATLQKYSQDNIHESHAFEARTLEWSKRVWEQRTSSSLPVEQHFFSFLRLIVALLDDKS